MIKIKDNQFKINRNELMEILQVSNSALKTIVYEKKLKRRLNKKGYELLDIYKEGRKTFYIVEKVNNSLNKLSDILSVMFGTNDVDRFGDYVLYRSENIKRPISKVMISEFCDVSRKTITKWDGKMIENNFLEKDGYYYIAIDYDEINKPNYRLTCKEEYMNYYKCSRFAKMRKNIIKNFKEDKITYDEMQLLMDGINENAKAIDKRFVYRIRKFILVEENKLFEEVKDLIKNTRKIERNYTEDWLEECVCNK